MPPFRSTVNTQADINQLKILEEADTALKNQGLSPLERHYRMEDVKQALYCSGFQADPLGDIQKRAWLHSTPIGRMISHPWLKLFKNYAVAIPEEATD
ncbi:MAG: hypothetical protein K0S07_707 [Chlamydiales bacterium]|jgi:hypothetical protein|nr:hypothetical protein [Chlamydiales bacterium]